MLSLIDGNCEVHIDIAFVTPRTANRPWMTATLVLGYWCLLSLQKIPFRLRSMSWTPGCCSYCNQHPLTGSLCRTNTLWNNPLGVKMSMLLTRSRSTFDDMSKVVHCTVYYLMSKRWSPLSSSLCSQTPIQLPISRVVSYRRRHMHAVQSRQLTLILQSDTVRLTSRCRSLLTHIGFAARHVSRQYGIVSLIVPNSPWQHIY